MSNFAFLADEFPDVLVLAAEAERQGLGSPGAAAIYARKTLEVLVKWLYAHDRALRPPYEDTLSALIHESTFRSLVGDALFTKARLVIKLGNRAAHEARELTARDATQAVSELFHICFWLASTFGRKSRPPANLAFDVRALSRREDALKRSFAQLQALASSLSEKEKTVAELLAEKEAQDKALAGLRAELAAVKAANLAAPIAHDADEATTRDAYIDILLAEAGWQLEDARDREFEISGMPNGQGVGYADYVLWGEDGKPLAVVEAKRTRRSPREGQQQAKLYADGLEARCGQRPVIFTTNGYEHWIWDDTRYPPREVQGFLKRDELQLLIERRRALKPLVEANISKTIVERYYQRRAITKVAQAFETDQQRKALLVMATGSGKTRTVIALVDLLMKANWAKRVLFLCDRVALVNQAVDAFKAHLPDVATVNLVTDKAANGRVYVSTYPTMMNLIDQKRDDGAMFGVGHFDLVIVDEAHRSIYQRFGAIFDYFDSLLVGLTATPRDEIDRNTYGLFELEDGVPTDYYSLERAVQDEYLVPPVAISVPLKFQRDGIRYDDLSDAEKEQWDMLEWDDNGPPAGVDANALNQWLFNIDTVDKVLAHVMTHGLKVEGGDRLGKTIIFAKNQAHADFIEERFNANYPELKGQFARIITFKTEYAQSLIDDFSTKDKAPHIAISVDMLDTGIDVPEVLNLVLFKLIRSKTKFWQIIGRGTRLCEDLFGPGHDKECFYVFDFCQNLEFFSQNGQIREPSASKGLSQRLFEARLTLVATLDEKAQHGHAAGLEEPAQSFEDGGEVGDEQRFRERLIEGLHAYVAGMNLDNFVVRPHRRAVEKYQAPEAWIALDQPTRDELVDQVASLPTDVSLGNETAKRFDMLVINLQLSLLRADKAFDRHRKQLVLIAAALLEQLSIPVVRQQQELILEIQSDPWWEGLTVPILELVRLRLRDLVQHIDKTQRPLIYADFEDQLGEQGKVDLPGIGSVDFSRFKRKARHFLLEHQDNLTLQKLRRGKPLTQLDLDQLAQILVDAGVGDQALIAQARELSHGFGRFVRSLVGLERPAVAELFSEFLTSGTATAKQIEFLEMIIEELTENGVMDPKRLYQSPFSDTAPTGPESVFDLVVARKIVDVVRAVDQSAAV